MIRILSRIAVALALALGAMYGVGKGMAASREPERTVDLVPEGRGAAFVVTASGRSHVLDLGRGPAVLLLHGSGRSVADWQQGFAEDLAESFRVVAFDDYGFGRSDRSHPFRHGSALWAAQAIEVLDALGIREAIVLGHSAGGVVAAALAADHPERVRGAVFVGHGLAMDPTQMLPFIPGVGELVLGSTEVFGCTPLARHCAQLRAAYRVRGTREALLTFIRRQYTIDGLRLLSGTYEQIEAPVLQVHGGLDASIPLSAARGLTARLRNARLVVVEEASHDVHLTAPDRLARELRSFASGLEPAGRRSEGGEGRR
jgi:pimeloyl-ACP methyl ester carboxylesterase